MELGEKLKTARQEAGLSQRQLCGDVITRNMLSQIEHGTARPSMETLRYLASRLEKPLSWFLEEDAAVSFNQALMEQVRKADAGHAWLLLKTFRHPDPMLEWEWHVRSFLAGLGVAEQAFIEGKWLYARQLLEEVQSFEHGIPELERKRLWLLGRIPGADLPAIVQQLPPMDTELLLRAGAALEENNAEKAISLLSAAEEQESPKRNLLLGKARMQQGDYAEAANCLQCAESTYPETLPLLEECFRELGDFKKAYEYACKQR